MKTEGGIAVKRNRAIVGLLVWCLGSAWSSVLAGSGMLTVLPMTRGKKLPSGIIAKVDTRWTDGWGYRPVRVTLSVRKSTRDRTIQVDLYPESYSKYQKPLRVSAKVEIPQGQTQVTETIYVPQQLPWSTMRAEFFENRRKLKDLSMDYGMGWNSGNGTGAPCVLLVDADAPSITDDRGKIMSELKRARQRGEHRTVLLPDAEKFQYLNSGNFARGSLPLTVEDIANPQRGDDFDSLQFVGQVQNLEILPPSDLPTSYLGLSGIDLMVMSLDDLVSMSRSDPERFRAVDFHIRAGSNLVVYAEQGLVEGIDELLNLDQPWTDATQMAEFKAEIVAQFAELDDTPPTARQRKMAEKAAKNLPLTQLASHGLGRVIAIKSDDPYGESVAYWQWVLRSIGLDRLTWPERMGVSLVHENSDYWDFMIPGFGAAPVKRFLGVICVFIIVIGPLNFFLLNRAKRLYLLPITVGVAALLTTLGMLGYAVVSDGISTRVRLRSYTNLDQGSEQTVASTHCRQSYLAAIAPSDGLVFPSRTGVYPILPYYDDRQREEEVSSRTSTRVLGQGYLRSRSTTQFLTSDVQETEDGLEIETSADGTLGQVTNRLGASLRYAWLRDAQGDLFQAQQVADNKVLELSPVDLQKAKVLFDKIVAANTPRPPVGLDKNANRTMFGDLGSRRYYYRIRSAPVYTSNSVLETHLKQANGFFGKRTPNTFLLVTKDVPSYVATGTSAKQEAGFHVIEGRW